MSKEHELMEAIAVILDDKADSIFADIANGDTDGDPKDADDKAQAYRRCAEIIRHQVECEA